jgi:DNA-binding transcriptional ArsR family regulator
MTQPSHDQKAQAEWIVAIGEPTRLAILRALTTGTHTVIQLAKVCNVESVNISHHLVALREAGLVTFERDGRFSRYALAGAKATATMLELTHESGMKVLIPLG